MITHEQICSAIAKAAETHPIKKVSYFGSFADGRATSKSDLDILVEFHKPRISLFVLSAIKLDLENLYCKGEMSNLLLKYTDSRIIRSKIKRHSQVKGGCPASNHRYVHGHHPTMYISKIKWMSMLHCSIIPNYGIA